MLIEKDIWDLVQISLCFKCQNLDLFTEKVKEDQMVVDMIWHIILEDINNQIALNIIDLKDLKQM